MVEVCRVSFLSTHGKSVVRRVPLDCRVLNPRHTAKVLFAVCPTLDTRQIFWRTAYVLFPVVAPATWEMETSITSGRCRASPCEHPISSMRTSDRFSSTATSGFFTTRTRMRNLDQSRALQQRMLPVMAPPHPNRNTKKKRFNFPDSHVFLKGAVVALCVHVVVGSSEKCSTPIFVYFFSLPSQRFCV